MSPCCCWGPRARALHKAPQLRQVSFDPERVQGPEFRELLRGLVDAIAEGSFVQEPTACDWCDFTAVCGPKGLIDARRRYKVMDPRVQRVLRLRDVG